MKAFASYTVWGKECLISNELLLLIQRNLQTAAVG